MKSIFAIEEAKKATNRRIRVGVEPLEARLALSTALHAIPLEAHAPHLAATIGTLKGRISNQVNGRPMSGVKVQLIDSIGDVVATTRTNLRGKYSFKMKAEGAYVVHAVSPRRFTQTTPSFAIGAPIGEYAIDPATGLPYTAASWNYHSTNSNPAYGPVGPPYWGTIAPAGDEPFGSPINITVPPVDLGKYLSISYNPAIPKAIVNNGSQIQAQMYATGGDTIDLSGTVYNLSQFHYHDPSENEVGGKAYAMEEHFVNTSASGAETVVAVFLQLGGYNASLQPILDAASAHLTAPGSTYSPTTPVDFAGLLPSSLQGWFYNGSLTTPPLSQVVNWLVLATPITLDSAQLAQYEAVADGAGFLPNARPIQPQDGRQVNEFNIDVNYAGGTASGANFTYTRIAGTCVSHATEVASRMSIVASRTVVTRSIAKPNHHD